ncbi:hypothetical protein [Aquimonas voraii]|uniref:Cation/multidrug efflux pump n=1 Tax=Aquimonas voraii TaxID=265719 RepID=A0A1G6UPV6_9GAMM|nr:hypothetical protein [Aquimonas voraii]SDD43372.1 hypothetical protein SAMN04488509_102437 [Aquimonas voraii]
MLDVSPATCLIVAAALPLLFSVALFWRSRRPAGLGGRLLRLGLALALAFFALILALLGLAIFGYARLLQETDVATLAVRQVEPQRFAVDLGLPDGTQHRFELTGDQWQLDARVLRWRLPALLAGAPSLYRLERLSSRYSEAEQEREAPRSVHALGAQAFPDLWTLRRQFPQYLGFVDADFGSGVYLPLIDGARYRVSLGPRGGLVARPADAQTERLLQDARW